MSRMWTIDFCPPIVYQQYVFIITISIAMSIFAIYRYASLKKTI
ncbi:hypothetical protein [Streptococcus agalactiae]|nr:hypothetical protein [Streptococcus agalactiae]OTG49706.1 hypothetical protein B7934_01115 [Streptococcus agalactiae]